MSLLDAFLLEFKQEGLSELSDEVKDADKNLDNFEEQAKQTEQRVNKLGKAIERDGNARFKALALNVTRALTPMVLFGKALHQTIQFASEALEVAQAAQENGMSLEQFQAQDGNKYQIYNRDDVNNAKEYEQVMRDIRMGSASIGAIISRAILPAFTALAKVARNVIDFFIDHGEFIKAAFIGIAAVITAFAIPAVIEFGAALWAALAPMLPFIAAAVALALVFEDLWKWMHGEPSVSELLFGDFETVKNNVLAMFEDVKKAFEPFVTALIVNLQTFLEYIKALFNFISAIFRFVFDKAQALFNLIGQGLSKQFEFLKEIGKFIIDLITNIMRISAVVSKLGAKALNTAAEKIDGSHASGLDYVPFDGYIAELHKGERVQTADEANDWRSGLMAAKKAINFTASYPLNAIPSGAVSNAYNNAVTNDYNNSSSNKTINIGDITIQTQATDAQGIAIDLASYIKQAVISLDDGMLA